MDYKEYIEAQELNIRRSLKLDGARIPCSPLKLEGIIDVNGKWHNTGQLSKKESESLALVTIEDPLTQILDKL